MAKKDLEPQNPLWKVIGTDIAGVTCIIMSPLIGWLPGPGGIPLLITGLGLLSINHEKPRSWLLYVKKHSKSVQDVIFPDTPLFMWAWDIVALCMLVGGILISIYVEWWLIRGMSLGFMAGATTVFLLNRDRLDRIEKWFKARKKKK